MLDTKSKRKFYYGWVVFAGCFLMVMVALGFGSSTKGTYLKAVTEGLGIERGLFTIGESFRYIMTAILHFAFGAIIMKLGARRMIGFGFLFLCLSFGINAMATQVWHFYIGGTLLGAGLAWTTTTIVGTIVENWFTNSKGTIMGFILCANGLGGVLSEQIITRVLYGMDGTIADADARWRLGYAVSAILFAVVGIIVVLIVRNKPSDMGLEPLGQDKQAKSKRGMNWEGYEMQTVLKKPFFYISGICVFCTGFFLQGMSNMAKPFMYDIGLSKEFVLYVFSVHAIFLILAKIWTGICYDKFGIRITFGFCSICAFAALVLLLCITPDSNASVWAYAVLSSLAMPLETVVVPLMVSQMFGKKCFAKVMGYYMAIQTIGCAIGSPLVNAVYDKAGSYRPAVIGICAIMLICVTVSQFSIYAADKSREKFLAEK